MIVAIAGAEVAFWVVLLAGLVLRYLARRERLSRWVLRCVPLVDVVLLALVAVDLARGATPEFSHALAAVYLGVTVAFGHSMLAWADGWFRYRFAGGPRPQKPAKGSRAEVVALWREWGRLVLADVIAVVLLLVMAAIAGISLPSSVDDLAQQPYWGILGTLGVVTVIWFLAGPAFAGRGQPDHATPDRATSNRQ